MRRLEGKKVGKSEAEVKQHESLQQPTLDTYIYIYTSISVIVQCKNVVIIPPVDSTASGSGQRCAWRANQVPDHGRPPLTPMHLAAFIKSFRQQLDSNVVLGTLNSTLLGERHVARAPPTLI